MVDGPVHPIDPALAAESLRDSEARYRILFEQHPVPMWVYAPDTLRFLDVNEAAVTHYGYSREEFLAMTILEMRPEEDVARLLGALGSGPADGAWRHRLRDGSIIDVEIVSREVVFAGTPVRLIIATDVTARMKTERKLREALDAERAATIRLRALDEMKNTFLNAVSHELRTPLSAVIGSAKTLERIGDDLSPGEHRAMLRAITRNAGKLNRMLSDLLDLDRMSRGVLRPRRSPEELGSLVRRVAEDPEVIDDRRVEIDVHQMVLPVDAPKVERIVEKARQRRQVQPAEHADHRPAAAGAGRGADRGRGPRPRHP
jgi:PAS domain S-box-containing protein